MFKLKKIEYRKILSIVGVLCLLLQTLSASPTTVAREIVLSYKSKGFINIRSEKSGKFSSKGRASFSASLLAGVEYLAVVGSEDHVSKVGVYVFDKDRKKMAVVNKHRNKGSSIVFKPKKDGRYTFLVISKSGKAKYKLFIVTKSPSWIK